MEELKKIQEEVEERVARIATLTERQRIMSEIEMADLPAGIWLRIRKIINPENK